MNNKKPTGSRYPAGVGRRDVLKLGAVSATLAATGIAGFFPRPALAQQQPAELVLSFGPDDSGTLQHLIDAFNREHEGRIRVRWRKMARETDAHRRQLISDFMAGAADIDVIGADVIWTAEFASRGWVQDLSSRFYAAYDPEGFVDPALNSAVYRNRVWAVPWFTDAGMLYYRRDLLEQAGIQEPPATWDELKDMARRITQEAGIAHGFVFQGAEYEGGVTNALEYIWSTGGQILGPGISVAGAFGELLLERDAIAVDTPESARGLDLARSMIVDGVAPEDVTNFRERETYEDFLAGNAVFMRNWPFAYGLIGRAEGATLTPEQVGVAPIPTATPDGRSFGCLGGWNLMVNRNSAQADAAWAFIQYATTPAAQKRRALEGGFLPSLRALYDDPEVEQQAPGVALGKTAVLGARVRPITPYYPDLSPRIARAYNLTLGGELEGREAVQRLAQEMQTIIRRQERTF